MANTILTMLNKLVSIDNNLYYKSGDVIDCECYIHTVGCLTGSKKSIQCGLILPKSLTNISSVKCDRLFIVVRTASGGYIFGNGDIPQNVTSNITVCNIQPNNSIYIQIDYANAFSSYTNNTPLSVIITSIKLTLS